MTGFQGALRHPGWSRLDGGREGVDSVAIGATPIIGTDPVQGRARRAPAPDKLQFAD